MSPSRPGAAQHEGSAPRVVAIGGGHGLAATLRAVRRLTPEITAVVSVADDGGSSGRLRADRDRPAPGDLRKCLVALADENGAQRRLARSLEHRFDGTGLQGHALGNLMIVALSESGTGAPDDGGLVEALDDLAQLLGVVGRVLPTSTEPLHLRANLGRDSVVGQVAVAECNSIDTVSIEPPDAVATPEAIDAIERADTILVGPGSLYTSVLAATVVPGITEAIRAADAPLVYICNLRPQDDETADYDVAGHVEALARHGLEPDVVLYDPSTIGDASGVPNTVAAQMSTPSGLAHDPERLAAALEPFVLRRAEPGRLAKRTRR